VVERLVYVFGNTLVVSDILSPEVWDLATQTLTIDPIASDIITGQCIWQTQRIAVFRSGSTWVVETGPNLPVLDWELNRVSGTIGCCCHGTIVQCGADVYFLSETGRGVYALSQAPASTQQGVWQPLSLPIKHYIDRINWSAIANARATVALSDAGESLAALVWSFEPPAGPAPTGLGDIPMAVRAMREGAIDFLTKPVDDAALLKSVERAFQQYRESRREAVEHQRPGQNQPATSPQTHGDGSA